MKQGPIGMAQRFRTSSTTDSPLTTHHTRRNRSPQSRPYALEAVLAPAVGVDLGTPRERPGDPHRDRIFILGESISGGRNHPPPSTYLCRSLDTKLLQPRKSDCHAVERPRYRVVILPSQREPLGVAIRKHHSLTYTRDLLDGPDRQECRRRHQVHRVFRVRTGTLVLQTRGFL